MAITPIIAPTKISKLRQLHDAMLAINRMGWALQFIQTIMNGEPIDESFRMRALEDALSDRWKRLTDEQHKYLEYVISNYPDIIKEARIKAYNTYFNM